MKRFYNDEPEQEPEDFFHDNNEEFEGQDDPMMNTQFIFDEAMEGDIQLNLLAMASNFVNSGFFSKFKSHKTKLMEIKETYKAFLELLSEADTEPEPEEG
jgi:hypothetical protein